MAYNLPPGVSPFSAAGRAAVQQQYQQRQLEQGNKEDRVRSRMQVPGFDNQYQNYGRMSDRFGARQAQFSDFRNQQQGLGSMLAAEARGQGIGQQVVRQQAQGMADRGVGQQLAMAASARPGQGHIAGLNAAQNAGNINSQVGGQAALAGGQMALGAQGQYAQFLQGARGMDEDTRLRQLGLNDQAQLNALGQRLQASGMQQQGNQFDQQLRVNRAIANMQEPTPWEKTLGAAMGGAQVGAMLYGSKG